MNTANVMDLLGIFQSERPTIEEPVPLRKSLDALLAGGFAPDASFMAAVQVLAFLFDDVPVDLSGFPLGERDRLLADNILKLKPYIVSFGTLRRRGTSIRASGVAEDCLADDVNDWSSLSWSALRVLNLALMASIPARKRVAIVTSVRNEGLSILEWLAHHRATGFNDFFIYTNDNTDGSDRLLRTLAEFGVIHLIENHVGSTVPIQRKILEHSLHLVPELREFEWAFYVDVDEFFVVRCGPAFQLDDFFDFFHRKFSSNPPSAISFNWKWFGSENAFEMTEGLLLERFIYSIHNDHVKSLVALRDIVSMHRVHTPVLRTGAWLANSAMERVDPSIKMTPVYGHGQINHYWNKSFVEFVLKRSRGRISKGLSGAPLDFSSFFDWGANGRRGNLDPPDKRIVDRLKLEYRNLLSIPGIEKDLELVQSSCREMLAMLDRDLNMKSIYERRGKQLETR